MEDEGVFGSIPDELNEPSTLKLFNEVAYQDGRRGWAILHPADLDDLDQINKLVDSGLIVTEPGSRRFDEGGRAKGAEVVCRLTEAGKLATALLANPID